MKIAVFHNQPSGGARRALHGFVRELSARHLIDIYTLTSADDEMLHDEDVASSVTRVPFAFPSLRRGQLYFNDLRRWQGFRMLAQTNCEVAAIIDTRVYDVVLVDACRYLGAPYILDHLQTPAVYFCHHRLFSIDHASRAPAASRYAWIRDRVHQPIERRLQRRLWHDDARLMSRSARILINSEFSRRRLGDLYKLPGVVCRYGVDLPRLAAGTKPAGHVLSVGTLEEHKGHHLVVDALACIPRDRRPRLLIVANDGNPAVRARLENRARSLEVELLIKMLPAQAELDRAYREASLLAFGAYDEPLGLVVLEAMAHGVPVVAVGEGGVVETVVDGETGYLTRRDAAEMGTRISELVADDSLRERMGACGRRSVERHWAWPERAMQLEAVLAEVAADGAHPTMRVVA